MNSNIQEKSARKTNCFQNSMRQYNDYYTEFTARFRYLIVKEMAKNICSSRIYQTLGRVNAIYYVCPAAFTIATLTLHASICESECHTLASVKSRRICSESSDFTILHLIQMMSSSPLVMALGNQIYAAA